MPKNLQITLSLLLGLQCLKFQEWKATAAPQVPKVFIRLQSCHLKQLFKLLLSSIAFQSLKTINQFLFHVSYYKRQAMPVVSVTLSKCQLENRTHFDKYIFILFLFF